MTAEELYKALDKLGVEYDVVEVFEVGEMIVLQPSEQLFLFHLSHLSLNTSSPMTA